MHAAENDMAGIGPRCEARELQRVAGEVGVLINVGALIVVAEQHGLLAEARARGTDSLMTGVVVHLVELVEVDGCALHGGGTRIDVREARRGWQRSVMPGQAGVPPAADLASLAAGVLVALEALEHIVAVARRGLTDQCRCLVRTHAAAADEHQQ